ncbi:DUF5655 domain-containing protein [Methanobrevibacter sp. DSM 116169]|uniref:DUF5655 domain-containing protein n=1 Tax=Methanobrevibacter sp. DSM 116169 TaxID=3242727 RepID=UPI0038FD07AE
MSLFTINNENLEVIEKSKFKLEREMQKITENNLNKIFNLEFVTSEFQLNNLRIDTLAFDKESNGFVIIEYKNLKTFSVIDQGYSYLALLLNNKADFILEYNEKMDESLGKNDIDWSQSRVIFISPSFTTYQRQAMEFKDLPMELVEITKYSNNTVLYNRLKPSVTNESIKTIQNNEEIKEVNKEVKVYKEEDHLEGKSEDVVNFYYELKNRILSFDEDISFKSTKMYVSFSLNSIFLYLYIYNKNFNLYLSLRNGKEIIDPLKLTKYIEYDAYGKNAYNIVINSESDLDYLMTLIKQAYDANK